MDSGVKTVEFTILKLVWEVLEVFDFETTDLCRSSFAIMGKWNLLFQLTSFELDEQSCSKYTPGPCALHEQLCLVV